MGCAPSKPPEDSSKSGGEDPSTKKAPPDKTASKDVTVANGVPASVVNGTSRPVPTIATDVAPDPPEPAAQPASTPVLADPAHIDNFPDLKEHHNCMSDVLTPELYNKLKDLRTTSGFSLDSCIQTGVDNPGHPFIYTVGAVAGDEESYHLFGEFFDKVIEKRHGGYPADGRQPTDLDPSRLGDVEGVFDEKYVLSCRVRTGRSIRGFRLPPANSRAERRHIETVLKSALMELDGDFYGKYFPLGEMTEAQQNELIADHFLFDKPVSPLLLASRMGRDWPDARGIWHNHLKNFLVWVNEEDHMRIISMQTGGDMKTVFSRFCEGLSKVESLIKSSGLEFMWNPHHGFILTCPSNLGTGMRAGVHIRIPLISKHPEFDAILKKLRLQKRGTGGVDTASTDGTFDISNSDRLGVSEVELTREVINGVNLLIQLEKSLEGGADVSDQLGNIKVDRPDIERDCVVNPNEFKPVVLTPKASDFPDFSKHNNWTSKCLTEDIYNRLKDVKTSSGFDLDSCIQTGVDNPGHPFIMTVGAVAGDEESYSTFADFFEPVIEKRHNGYTRERLHVTSLDADASPIGDDLDPDYVISVRVRTGRSIRGLALPPHCSRYERRMVEYHVVGALNSMESHLEGGYHPLGTMTSAEQDQYIADHFLFDKPVSPLLLSSNMARDWPDARGIWHNHNKNFLVWVNEEDHIRLISMEKGGALRKTFLRFCDGLKTFERHLESKGLTFMWNSHLGYILTCPSNLGTGIRAGVHIKIPLLSKNPNFDLVLKTFRLQKRGTGGVDTASTDGVFDISNLDRLGFSEVELVHKVYIGVKYLIEMEKTLAAGEPLDSLITKMMEDAARD